VRLFVCVNHVAMWMVHGAIRSCVIWLATDVRVAQKQAVVTRWSLQNRERAVDALALSPSTGSRMPTALIAGREHVLTT
jgi:hypothetical protein